MRIPQEVKRIPGHRFIALSDEVAAAILLTLEAGWKIASASAGVNTTAGEVEITEYLREGMRQALESPKFQWRNDMTILPGTESRSRSEILTPDGRTDISILMSKIRLELQVHDPHAIIECKRIAGSETNLCRLYVIEGIDRFQIGKYAGNHSVGFMVGYLLSNDAAAAVSGINRYLTNKGRHAERLNASNLIGEAWAWGSNHPRTDALSPIELHHAFFRLNSRKS